MQKKCNKCKATFNCSVEDISSCECTQINLSELDNFYISKIYADCLCLNCLIEIQKMSTDVKKE